MSVCVTSYVLRQCAADRATSRAIRHLPHTSTLVAMAGETPATAPARTRVYDWYGDGRLLVADLGLACCTLEFEAAALDRPVVEPSSDTVADPGTPLAVVVSGTVPDALVPVVREAVAALAQTSGRAPAVIAYGACASSGGPYWDSYAVADGISSFLPVAAYVPGCPPPPGSLEDVLAGLAAVAA